MKIILPIKKDGDRFIVSKGFHNSENVSIYNSTDKSYQWIESAEIEAKTGSLSLGLKNEGIFVVICHEMPLMALKLFRESGIKVFKAQGKEIENNIDLFYKNELLPYHVYSSSDASACNSSCSSCSSTCN